MYDEYATKQRVAALNREKTLLMSDKTALESDKTALNQVRQFNRAIEYAYKTQFIR